MERRSITTERLPEEKELELSLRPKTLSEYIGQEELKAMLKVYIEAARSRGEPLDHVLFYGPPGLGKTTLAGIIANEMGANLKVTSGPAIERPGELVAVLSGMKPGDVLFIDEIHRLNRQVEEVLYPAMEDFVVDIVLGKESGARSMRYKLPPFTLVGATTRAGMLTAPLRDRFGVVHHLEFYKPEELKTIVKRSAKVLGVEIEEDGAMEIASRSRGTPRLANRFLKRVRDFAQVRYDGVITREIADETLKILNVDSLGLDRTDRKLLRMIIENYGGGPVGLETLSAALGEDSGTMEDVCEPYLLQNGFLKRTPRGRMATEKAYLHLGYALPGYEDGILPFLQER
ncbi:MAG: Holliday junction branch migration DNA helicase RuvB [Lachnospiraceae bacterium]|nr:Holliday junction branch migration DNA helicase RuvB [Lachnospiraceae bacterium]